MTARALALLVACGLTAPALARPRAVTHFRQVSINKLQVMQLIDQDALVEGPAGEVALVRLGDVLGREQARVHAVGKGCVAVRLGRVNLSLCSEVAPTPRS